MESRQASCSCGQLRIFCEGEPIRISMCHCLACQKRSGSVFAAQARWPIERVRCEGTATTWSRTGDEGGTCTFSFCGTCGATVYYMAKDQPDWVAVPIGMFGDPQFPQPTVSVYENRMHAWVRLPDQIEHF